MRFELKDFHIADISNNLIFHCIWCVFPTAAFVYKISALCIIRGHRFSTQTSYRNIIWRRVMMINTWRTITRVHCWVVCLHRMQLVFLWISRYFASNGNSFLVRHTAYEICVIVVHIGWSLISSILISNLIFGRFV